MAKRRVTRRPTFELAHVDDVESRPIATTPSTRAVAQVLAGTPDYALYKEVTMRGIARLAVSELQLAFAYFNDPLRARVRKNGGRRQ